MNWYITTKPNNEKRVVVLCKYKHKPGYTFVNLSTGNITECVFDSVEDAERDLNEYVAKGLIKSYKEL